MQKLSISVPAQKWGTLKTKYPADSNVVDAADFTAGTKNIQTSVSGLITKRPGGVVYSTLSTPAKDQYEVIFSDGVHHLLTVNNGILNYTTGNGVEHQILTGLSATLYNEFVAINDKVYFSNGVTFKVYDRTTSYGGATYTFPTQTVKDVGCQVPQSAATFNADSAGGSVPVGSHHYIVTFLYYGSEESNGGPASAVHVVSSPNQTVNLKTIPIGGYGVTARNIYRDDNDGVYVLVGVINDNTTVTFADTVNAGLTPLPTFNNIPSACTLLNVWNDSLFIGGVPGDPYTLFYSNTLTPDIFDPDNTIDCDTENVITAIVEYLGRQVVFNRGSMGQILGDTPDTYRYIEIDPSVGCVDNRSVQIRVINGIPLLIWLSENGVYAYDGSNITYISDDIEDQINFNIQQSSIQKNKITQSSLTDFEQGFDIDGNSITSIDARKRGINLESDPGNVTMKGPYWDTVAHPLATLDEQTNPTITFDSDADWEGGLVVENVATKDGLDSFKDIQPFTPTLASGTLTGAAYIDGSNLKLPVHSDFTGESNSGKFGTGLVGFGTIIRAAYPISINRSGNFTTISNQYYISVFTSGTFSYRLTIWSDLLGSPGVVLAQSDLITQSFSAGINLIDAFHIPISYTTDNNTTYWIGINGNYPTYINKFYPLYLALSGGYGKVWDYSSASWVTIPDPGPGGSSLTISYVFSQKAVQSLGSWTSPIYDSLSETVKSLTINTGSTSFPSATSGRLILDASSDPLFISGISTYVLVNPSGDYSGFPYDNNRFYRFTWELDTVDDRTIPSVPAPQIPTFGDAVWISQILDCTADVTSYDELSFVQTGSGGVVTIATSTDGITFSSFTDLGSAVVHQYVKIKLIPGSLSNTITSVTFSWTLTSTFVSSAIDIGITPLGWDIFQSDYQTNSGSVTFYMKSAATSGGLAAATWYSVTNGSFPTTSLPILEWVEYKTVITSSANHVPTIHSVTINWFLGNDVNQSRIASIFYNKSYFLIASEILQTHNNIIFELDFEGKWRVHKDVNISTLSFFFGTPYYGDAVTGEIVSFRQGLQDKGQPITCDIFTKEFEFSTEYVSNIEKVKILNEVILQLANTGATFNVYFSTDSGTNWNLLYNNAGFNSWTLPTNRMMSFVRLRPNYTTSISSGQTIMLNIHNSDSQEVKIQSFKLEAIIRKQKNVITG